MLKRSASYTGAANTTDSNRGKMSSTFADAYAALPAEVQAWVTDNGLTDHGLVADSVTPEYLRDHAGATVVARGHHVR